jgi:hypothetical protein
VEAKLAQYGRVRTFGFLKEILKSDPLDLFKTSMNTCQISNYHVGKRSFVSNLEYSSFRNLPQRCDTYSLTDYIRR